MEGPPGVAVQVLAREPRCRVRAGVGFGHCAQRVAPRRVLRLPHRLAVSVGKVFGEAAEVVVVVADALLLALAVDPGQGA